MASDVASTQPVVSGAQREETLRRLVELEGRYESVCKTVADLEGGGKVTNENSLMDAALEGRTNALADIEREEGQRLASRYLVMNQAAYALAALPIGTILSVAPLYLRNTLGVPMQKIGYMMMVGELVGIIFMKYAEASAKGFVLRRPNDMHLIMLAAAGALMVLPLWPSALWVGAVVSMIVVQAFNSASKPVIAEALHRLSVLTRSEPSNVFAKANQWRRVGNAVVGASTPMLYIANPLLPFYCSAPVLVVFTLAAVWVEKKVDTAFERFSMSEVSVMRPTTSPESTIGAIQQMTAQGSEQSKRASVTMILESVNRLTERDGPHKMARGSHLRFQILLFAVVHAFPFMDAYLSRMPFAFMTIAIADQAGNLWTACLALFAYQSTRAIGQWVQSYRVDNKVNYLLSAVSVVAYAIVLVAVLMYGEISWWFYPVICTGLSETLPVQQFYLGRLLAYETSSDGGLAQRSRDLVKASHTATGMGSAAAFLTSSLVYAACQQVGVGSLGVSVSAAKLLAVVLIGNSLPSSPAAAAKCGKCPEPQDGGAAVHRVPSGGRVVERRL